MEINLPFTYTRDGDRVTLTLTTEQFNCLLMCLGAAAATPDLQSLSLRVANAVNEGNSDWTPYAVPEVDAGQHNAELMSRSGSSLTEHCFAVLGVLMRRENRQTVRVTYDELSAQPIQLMMREETDGSIVVEMPPEELSLSPLEILRLHDEACAAGKPITRTIVREKENS